MNEQQKSKLQELKLKYKDQDSQNIVLGIERDWLQNIDRLALVDNPVFKEITKKAEGELAKLNTLLLNDDTLNDKQRANIFNQKAVWTFIFSNFGIKLYEDGLKFIEEMVDKELAR